MIAWIETLTMVSTKIMGILGCDEVAFDRNQLPPSWD
jgi:hypothetical protein